MRLVLTLFLACSSLGSALAQEAPVKIAALTEPAAVKAHPAKAIPAPSARISLDELYARQDVLFQRSLASLCAECVGLAGPDISIEVPALPPETPSD
jgi:hypothetical protein